MKMSTRRELEHVREFDAIRFHAAQSSGRITFTPDRPTEFYGPLMRFTLRRKETDIPAEF
jgi:hypothetical protein